MKTSFKYLLLIAVLSLLPFLYMLMTSLLPHTQDGLVHLPRMAAYFQALTHGQFPVRWATDLNFGYGMPLFIFMYPLPYLLASFFLFLGLGLVVTFKMVVVLSFILSGIFMFLLSKELFKKEKIAFLVTIFYQFAPFRLVESNIRGDIGEIYTYAFLPLVLWGILKNNFLLTAIAAGLLILSHNSISLAFFGVSFFFAVFFSKDKRFLFLNLLALFWGLALSAFYWLPALFEHKFTNADLFMRNTYQEYFSPLAKLFLPNFFNSKSLNMIDVPVQIGIFGVMVLVLSLLIFFERSEKSKDNSSRLTVSNNKQSFSMNKILIFSLLVFSIALFFTQPISQVFWQNLSYLRQFQFPWRFLALMVFATALCSGVAFSSFKVLRSNLVVITLLFLVIISTVVYWKTPFGYDQIKESDYWHYALTTTYYGETDTVWVEHPASSYPKERMEIIGGEGKIANLQRTDLSHRFLVMAKTPVHLIDKTTYFPGWHVFDNGQEIPVEFQDQNHRGLITFNLSTGEHQVEVKFTKTKDRIVGEITSGISLLLWIILLFSLKRGGLLRRVLH